MPPPTPDLAAGSGTWVNWNVASLVEDVPEDGTRALLDAILAGGAPGACARSTPRTTTATARPSAASGSRSGFRRASRRHPRADQSRPRHAHGRVHGSTRATLHRREPGTARPGRAAARVPPRPREHDLGAGDSVDGPVAALVEARDAGRIERIGVAGGARPPSWRASSAPGTSTPSSRTTASRSPTAAPIASSTSPRDSVCT